MFIPRVNNYSKIFNLLHFYQNYSLFTVATLQTINEFFLNFFKQFIKTAPHSHIKIKNILNT